LENKQPIIVGIDIRDLKLAVTGTKTYLKELIQAFENIADPEIKYVFLDCNLPVYGGESKFLKGMEHIYYFIWKQILLPYNSWRKGCSVLFCTDYFVPLIQPGFKTITVFHDALFFEIPEQYNPVWLKIFKTLAMPGAKKSAHVVVPSNFSKQRLHHFTKIPIEKFVTIYEGPKSILEQLLPGEKLKQIIKEINSTPFLLHVGSLDKRKNLPRLIRALKLLKEKGHEHLKLVLVGKASPKIFINNEAEILATIQEQGMQENVIVTGYLEDEELGHLYRNALAYIFPSLYEGFGIPMVEAFQFQVPISAANNSCLPEIGAEAAIYFDPLEETAIANSIELLINDPFLRKTLTEKATKRLELFSWKNAARELNQLFKQTAALN
jgi:glycosyltransferase involved in cell wall biosynthesis